MPYQAGREGIDITVVMKMEILNKTKYSIFISKHLFHSCPGVQGGTQFFIEFYPLCYLQNCMFTKGI